MRDASLLQLKDFTQDTAAKAVVASTGVVAGTLGNLVCQSGHFAQMTCQVVNGVSDYVKILVVMMVLDLLTGVMAARAEGSRIESRRLGVGTQRKMVMLMVVAVATMLDAVFHDHGLPTGHLLYSWTASWFIAVEALSLYENAGRLGVPLPKFLKSAIEFLLQRSEKAGAPVLLSGDAEEHESTPTAPDHPVDSPVVSSPFLPRIAK